MPPDMYNKDRVFVNEGEKIGSFKGVIHHYCFLTIEQAVNHLYIKYFFIFI